MADSHLSIVEALISFCVVSIIVVLFYWICKSLVNPLWAIVTDWRYIALTTITTGVSLSCMALTWPDPQQDVRTCVTTPVVIRIVAVYSPIVALVSTKFVESIPYVLGLFTRYRVGPRGGRYLQVFL